MAKNYQEFQKMVRKWLSVETEDINPLNGKKEKHSYEVWMCISMHSKGVDYRKHYRKRGIKPPIEL